MELCIIKANLFLFRRFYEISSENYILFNVRDVEKVKIYKISIL